MIPLICHTQFFIFTNKILGSFYLTLHLFLFNKSSQDEIAADYHS
ncbi:hypothetical protein J522_2601 [Acinetobacter baumannii 146457]|nr:hypothetical protein J522_2601 [Acinetobacter baumannii 146457]